MVEAAAYVVVSHPSDNSVVFHNLLSSTHKDVDLLTAVTCRYNCPYNTVQALSLFDRVPEQVLCYWLPPAFLYATLSMPNVADDQSPARVGLQTGDNHRFVRAAWEVPVEQIGEDKSWSFFAKGGEYEPYYDDIHLVVFWKDDGSTIKSFVNEDGKLLSRPQNLGFYHAEGITYPDRTTSDFSPRVMPKGIIFSSTGFALFPQSREYTLGYLGASYTRPFKVLVEAFVGSGDTSVSGSAARHYRPGVLNVLPNLLREPGADICDLVVKCISSRIRAFATDETTRYFESPFANSYSEMASLSKIAFATRLTLLRLGCELIEASAELESFVLCQFEDVDRNTFDDLYGPHPSSYDSTLTDEQERAACVYLACDDMELVAKAKEELGASRQVIKKSYFADRRLELASHLCRKSPHALVQAFARYGRATDAELVECTHRVLSYCLGVAFGRWDCRKATLENGSVNSPHPFDELPVCSPGMLIDPTGLPQIATPNGYPMTIQWSGILVDDEGHPDDVVRRIRDVMEVLWNHRADAIEKEACEILGVKTLREYFRKASKGGFFDQHISLYSKSRRKAPIYWLLQSSKRNYSLWMYYHKLDRDQLFKGLVNYVEPKIRLEATRFDTLARQKAATGDSGKEAKRLAREAEKQEEVLVELRGFEDKLRRVAELHLEPDRNDGVIFNISPLHELVPWKEAKKYWDELLEGKYEWSSIGQQLRQKGLVK